MIMDAGRCVKCGLCLPHCPTYRVSANEARSPRGRINLIQALDQGQLQADRQVYDLLASCLLCRRCEAICPSGVPFARIMDEGREMVRKRRPFTDRLAVALITRPRLARMAVRLGRALTPARWRWGQLVRQVEGQQGAHLQSCYAAREPRRGRVLLFPGCSGAVWDRDALHGAIDLLSAAGYEVQLPPGPVCCGALDAHAGNGSRSRLLMEKNRHIISRLGSLDAIVTIASGCGAQLQEYRQPGAPVLDIAAFLAREDTASRLQFRRLSAVAALHTPCTLENAQGGSLAVGELLSRIPGLEISALGERGGCCGAGGLAFISFPQQSESVRRPLDEQIEHLQPDYVLSSNLACRGFLQQGAARSGMAFLHPVTLLAQQLLKE